MQTRQWVWGLAVAIAIGAIWPAVRLARWQYANFVSPPLAMVGGDPYLRAMMRAISASEAPGPHPYQRRFPSTTFDTSRGWQHPATCMPIPWQEGACSTAAGRYQLLSTTWEEWATVAGLDSRNFAPDRQDLAVYHYLSRLGLQSYLQNNQAKRAFCQLGRASVWTSVPCGKERNRHTAGVLSYYRYFLAQESLGIEHPKGRAAVIENGELLKNK